MAGALLLRNLHKMQNASPGFSSQGVLLARLDLGGRRPAPEPWYRFLHNLHGRLETAPGVERVAFASNTLLIDRFGRRGMQVEDYQYAPGEGREFHVQFASPGYLETLKIPLAEGRDFAWTDGPSQPRVAIVNEVFARKFWPDRNAVGRRLRSSSGMIEMVGVAAP